MTAEFDAANRAPHSFSQGKIAHVDPTKIDELLRPFNRTGQPGFAVGIALDGVPQYRRGVGAASVELPSTLSPTIRMRIGSATKQFCALAIMLLAEDGRLSIDNSPCEYIAGLPNWAKGVTLRQLMSHTSGMRDSFDLLFQTCGPNISASPDAPLKMLLGLDDLNFAPGTSWRYNNSGYALLSEIVEQVSGQAFGEFLKARIFDRVGMHDTMLRPVDTDMLPNSASLHMPLPDGGWSRGVFGIPLRGEGGLVSTVDDMLRWLKHMSEPIVGSRESWDEMRTSYASHGYGLGLMLQKHRGLDTIHHAGAVAGGSAQALKVIDHELDIVVLNNNGLNIMAMYQLVDAIIDACIPDLPPPPRNAGCAPAEGTFYSRDTGRVMSLLAHDGAQFMNLSGMMLPTITDAEGTLSVQILPTDLLVKPDPDGSRIRLQEFGTTDTLERAEPAESESLDSWVGNYRAGATDLVANLVQSEQGFSLRFGSDLGSLTYMLMPIGPRLWQMLSPVQMPLGGTLEFVEDGFLYSTLSTTRLKFVREV